MVGNMTSRALGRVPWSSAVRLTTIGFSLIELMVVIGIIVLLMALLLPALAAARRQGYVAGTQGELQSIRSACEQYFTTFGAYPGLFAESDISASHGSGTSLSGTQNLMISLQGTTSGTGSVSDALTVNGKSATIYPPGGGPYDQGASQQYLPFFAPRAGEVAYVATTTAASYTTTFAPSASTTQFAMATLVDHFPDALPVLYYRRTAGVDGTGGGTTVVGTSAGKTAYYSNANAEFDGATLTSPSGSAFNQATYGAYTTFEGTTNLTAAVTNSAISATTACGGFVLIAAGPSRYYGTVTSGSTTTNDNIVVLGGR